MDSLTFLVVDNLFDRYILIVEPIRGTTSVYCEECDTWVATYSGDQVTTHDEADLQAKIVADHESDFATHVSFDTEIFK